MSNKLYLECYSGISGDMMVAALLDLGASQEVLNKALQSLPAQGFQTKVSRVSKSGLDACDFSVVLDKKHENHDHDMEYLHGRKQQEKLSKHQVEYIRIQTHENEHNNEGHTHEGHTHEGHTHEGHTHEGHTHEGHEHERHSHVEQDQQHPNHQNKGNINHVHAHAHEHRGLHDIINIIDHTEITQYAKELAVRIFTILAEAEAKAHGVQMNEVHFHEVGAIDSIVDIVAVAVCLDNLGIDEVIVPVLHEGTGVIRCQHGIIPIPVPAVSHIVSAHGLNLHITSSEGEFVTPTGAAIVAAIKTSDKLPKQFAIQKIGLGAGKRNYDRPSILRAMILKEESAEFDYVYKLESNIDDCSGEALGYVVERLLEAGAKDVHYTPVFMKKNRPAYQLNVICKEEEVADLERIIFEETTTIGIRRQMIERKILTREIQKKETSLGEVLVKVCHVSSGKRYYPEYCSVVEMCKKHQLSYQEVYNRIVQECNSNELR